MSFAKTFEYYCAKQDCTFSRVGLIERSLKKKVFNNKSITNSKRVKNRKSLLVALGLSSAICISFPAFSQNKPTPRDGLNLNIPANGVGYEGLTLDLTTSQIDLPPESMGSTLFKLDLGNSDCLTGIENCLRRTETIDLGYQKAFTSVSTKGLDLSLTPRAALRFNDESSSAIVGAVVEIGEDLRKGSNFENNTWYFFAGADAEAVTYSPNSIGRLTSGQFHLQDRIIVGDAQAGLGYRIGNADVSLSYLRREATAEDYSFNEDAAALSFTWKR